GSLSQIQDWKATARLLGSITESYLYVTRQPFVRKTDSFVGLQRVYAYGYDTETPCWFLNRGEFLEFMGSLNLDLVREFVFASHPRVWKSRETAEICGFLFKRKAT